MREFLVSVTFLLLLFGVGATPTQARSALPHGMGLAAEYAGDEDISTHPTVVFADDFEVESLDDLKGHWSTIHSRETLSLSNESPPGSPGSQSLEVRAQRGKSTGGYVYKVLDSGYDKLHVRFYVRFAEDYPYSHHFVRVGGRINPPSYPLGGAGERPKNHFSVGLDAMKSSHNAYPPVEYPPPGVWAFYNYWPEMRSWQTPWGDANPQNPSYYGNVFSPHPTVTIPRGEWICVEIMVVLNSSPEHSDGEIALWIDGKLVAHYGPGTVAGQWVRDTFRIDGTSRQQFEGFRWRLDMNNQINLIKLENYVTDNPYASAEAYLKSNPDALVSTKSATVWFDHLVAATEYIGPIGVQQ